MKRLIEVTLKQWKAKENRKPLLVNGIRQVGKHGVSKILVNVTSKILFI